MFRTIISTVITRMTSRFLNTNGHSQQLTNSLTNGPHSTVRRTITITMSTVSRTRTTHFFNAGLTADMDRFARRTIAGSPQRTLRNTSINDRTSISFLSQRLHVNNHMTRITDTSRISNPTRTVTLSHHRCQLTTIISHVRQNLRNRSLTPRRAHITARILTRFIDRPDRRRRISPQKRVLTNATSRRHAGLVNIFSPLRGLSSLNPRHNVRHISLFQAISLRVNSIIHRFSTGNLVFKRNDGPY